MTDTMTGSAEEKIERLERALRLAARNDATRYEYGQSRPWDGCKPKPGGIWLTPREIARCTLKEPGLATLDDPGEKTS